MTISLPASPSDGDKFLTGDIMFEYDGSAWIRIPKFSKEYGTTSIAQC